MESAPRGLGCGCDLVTVEQRRVLKPFLDMSELRRVMSLCHDVLRVEKPHVTDAFDELSKLLFAKLCDEIESQVQAGGVCLFKCDGPSSSVAGRISELFRQAIEEYRDIFPGHTEIELKPSTVIRIVEILESYSFLNTPIDIKGAAYEAFLRSALPVGKVVGQFFTPSSVVEFAAKIISPRPTESVIDPAAGTGGFLVACSRQVWQNLASDQDKRAYMTNNLMGSDIDPRMVRLARLNLLMCSSASPTTIAQARICCHNGLLDHSQHDIGKNKFDIALTNPPFGSRETDTSVLANFELGRTRTSCPSPVLFLERCLQLVKLGGRVAIVVPDSILANPSARDVRELIGRKSEILAVIKLPSETFIPYGSTAESSLLILRKKEDSAHVQRSTFMAEAKYVGFDRQGADSGVNDLPRLLEIYKDFLATQRPGVLSVNPKAFAPQQVVPVDRLDVKYHWHPELDQILQLLHTVECPVKEIGDVVEFRKETVKPAEQFPEKEFRYIGLANVVPGANELVYRNPNSVGARARTNCEKKVGSAIPGAALKVLPGDILFAGLRPYLRKVFVVPENFAHVICSTEFLVMMAPKTVDAEYLAYLLRSDIVLNQLHHQYTGIGRPRVTQRIVSKVLIPVPDREIQRKIADLARESSGKIATLTREMEYIQVETKRLRQSLDESVLGILQGARHGHI